MSDYEELSIRNSRVNKAESSRKRVSAEQLD